MSSTHKTDNVPLTQYVGIDIFNPLEDYNVDMFNISSAIGWIYDDFDALDNKYPLKTVEDITYYVSKGTGLDDENDGLTSDTAFYSIAKAISMIPQIVNHNVTINVAAGTYIEDVTLEGFVGKGTITLKGCEALGSPTEYKVNSVLVQRCTVLVSVIGLNAVSFKTGFGSFTSTLCSEVYINTCISTYIDATKPHFGILSWGSITYVINSTFSNSNGIYTGLGGTLYLESVSGTNNLVGITVANGSTAIKSFGVIITGNIDTSIQAGSQIIGSDGKSTSGYSPNLLINGDFKINQRALSSYTTANAYSVDRWLNYGVSTTITPITNGLTISCLSTSDSNLIMQSVEDYAKFSGKTVTLSVKYSALSLGTNTKMTLAISDGISMYSVDTTQSSGIISVTHILPSNITKLCATLVKYGNGTSFSVNVEWAKLELGSVPTPFVPRPIAEELAMCKRYYESFLCTSIVTDNSYGTYRYCSSIPLVEKRIFPTLKFDSANILNIVILNASQISYDSSASNKSSILPTVLQSAFTTTGANGVIFIGSADAEIY